MSFVVTRRYRCIEKADKRGITDLIMCEPYAQYFGTQSVVNGQIALPRPTDRKPQTAKYGTLSGSIFNSESHGNLISVGW